MFDERDNFIGQQNKAQHKKAAAAPEFWLLDSDGNLLMVHVRW